MNSLIIPCERGVGDPNKKFWMKTIFHPPPIPVGQLLNQQSLLAKIQQVKKDYSLPPLYSRYFDHPRQQNNHETFRIMQFNILAQGLSSPSGIIPPFPENKEKESSYGGFDLDENKDTIFEFDNCRRWRLIEEIIRHDPDVLALEECDRFDDFFFPILQSIGYSGKFQPKKYSPSCSFGFYSDGVALFWRNTSFVEDLEVQIPATNEPSCTYLLTKLKHLPTNESILFLATHLKAKSSPENENIRLSQVTHMFSNVEMMMKSGASEQKRCVFVGDFNADPYPIYKNTEVVEPLAVQYVLNWRDNFFQSAYDLPTDQHSTLYTTSKFRQGKESKHVIDYIFYSHQSLGICNRLGPPDPLEVGPNLSLPNLHYPSDHLSLVVDISILNPSVKECNVEEKEEKREEKEEGGGDRHNLTTSSYSIHEVPEERYEELSHMICKTLRESAMITDYGPEIVENICAVYTPENISNVFKDRYVIAAEREGRTYIGSGCLKGNMITGVFVLPTEHGNGIGSSIMNKLEEEARRRGLSAVELNSSISAVKFYSRIGYEFVEIELQDGGNRGGHYHMRKIL